MLLGRRGPEESTFRKETCLLFHTEFPEPLPLTCTLCLAPCTALSLTDDWALISLPQNVREDFPGGPVVKNPPTKAGDMGSIPGLGRFHMLQGNSALVTQATELVLGSPRPARTEDCVPGAPALLERVHCFLLWSPTREKPSAVKISDKHTKQYSGLKKKAKNIRERPFLPPSPIRDKLSRGKQHSTHLTRRAEGKDPRIQSLSRLTIPVKHYWASIETLTYHQAPCIYEPSACGSLHPQSHESGTDADFSPCVQLWESSRKPGSCGTWQRQMFLKIWGHCAGASTSADWIWAILPISVFVSRSPDLVRGTTHGPAWKVEKSGNWSLGPLTWHKIWQLGGIQNALGILLKCKFQCSTSRRDLRLCICSTGCPSHSQAAQDKPNSCAFCPWPSRGSPAPKEGAWDLWRQTGLPEGQRSPR